MFGPDAFSDFTAYVSQRTSPSLLTLYTVVVGWLVAQTAVLFGSARAGGWHLGDRRWRPSGRRKGSRQAGGPPAGHLPSGERTRNMADQPDPISTESNRS